MSGASCDLDVERGAISCVAERAAGAARSGWTVGLVAPAAVARLPRDAARRRTVLRDHGKTAGRPWAPAAARGRCRRDPRRCRCPLERLPYPQPRSPEHDDQRSCSVAVRALTRVSHDGDDLLHCRRVSGIAQTLVARWPSAVIARQRRRRPPTSSGVQQHRTHTSSSRYAMGAHRARSPPGRSVLSRGRTLAAADRRGVLLGFWSRYAAGVAALTFNVVFEDAGDGWVYWHVPELPEVQTQGADLDDARAMVRDAYRCSTRGPPRSQRADPRARVGARRGRRDRCVKKRDLDRHLTALRLFASPARAKPATSSRENAATGRRTTVRRDIARSGSQRPGNLPAARHPRTQRSSIARPARLPGAERVSRKGHSRWTRLCVAKGDRWG